MITKSRSDQNVDLIANDRIDRVTLTAEPFEESEFFSVMNCLLSDLADAPAEIQCRALNFLNDPSKLIRFESESTSRTVITFFVKPSQLLLDFCFAIRTGDFDYLFVKYAHSVSLADSGLVDLPILPTSEARQNDLDES